MVRSDPLPTPSPRLKVREPELPHPCCAFILESKAKDLFLAQLCIVLEAARPSCSPDRIK